MNTSDNNNERWRLPDGVEELLPDSAYRLEELRRKITDLHYSWGYDLVNPPLIEYLDSLLTGSGELLDIQTFKLVDQLSGKMMGVRADMTPQVARIDAHLLNTKELKRLFYMGTVLRTRPDSPGGSRSPLQLGAEIYGHQGVESDIEIIELMMQTVSLSGLNGLLLDLGHVGVYRGLIGYAGLDQSRETRLFEALQRKSQPEVASLLGSWQLSDDVRRMLLTLTTLNGDRSVIASAREALSSAGSDVLDAINELDEVVAGIEARMPMTAIHVDLAELRGYSYHTGVVFSVFSESYGHEIARGGRYDDIGEAFGRQRPATGYSTDLKLLTQALKESEPDSRAPGIFVHDNNPACWPVVKSLRETGERVVVRLTGSELSAEDVGCDRRLVEKAGDWIVESL